MRVIEILDVLKNFDVNLQATAKEAAAAPAVADKEPPAVKTETAPEAAAADGSATEQAEDSKPVSSQLLNLSCLSVSHNFIFACHTTL